MILKLGGKLENLIAPESYNSVRAETFLYIEKEVSDDASSEEIDKAVEEAQNITQKRLESDLERKSQASLKNYFENKKKMKSYLN